MDGLNPVTCIYSITYGGCTRVWIEKIKNNLFCYGSMNDWMKVTVLLDKHIHYYFIEMNNENECL